MCVVIVVECESDLTHVILALRPASSLASVLNGRQQQSDQNGDDGDHHQQLNQHKSEFQSLH